MSVQEKIWNYFLQKGFSAEGIAGIMGNIEAESGFIPNNVENRAPYTDEQYTTMVDNGTYQNFIYDGYGYGIVQWTYSSFKRDLLNRSRNNKTSIGDLNMQLDQLYAHLQSENVINYLKNANNVKQAAIDFMLRFEKPYNQSIEAQNYRAANAERFYQQFKNNKKTDNQNIKNNLKYNNNNKPLVCMQTQSTCFKGTSQMKVLGVLWHSTGANNKTLKRYVQPSDNDPNKALLLNKLGVNTNYNDWNHISIQAGLNAWIGTLADGTVTTVQTMPWDYRPWGCGSSFRGSCNNGWIQFEICEDNLCDANYFQQAYKEACELTAYLCKMYNLNPKGTVSFNGVNVPVILCHQDSYQLGLGSNHSDVYHWFNKYGKTMDSVRNDVAAILGNTSQDIIIPDANYNIILRYKDSGDKVRELQEQLIKLGYNVGIDGADGDFGKNTLSAVIKFQQDNNLDDDGEVGPQTKAAIQKALNKLQNQIYRVRKSWDDVSSQIGAYKNFENAKAAVIRLGSDYSVYDENGKVVYTLKQEPTPIIIINDDQPKESQKEETIIPANTYSDVMVGSSSKDERGQYRGGSAGDQTGAEVWILKWYNNGWHTVIRPKSAILAEKIAAACEKGCNNHNIGYDQWERNSLYTEAKKVNLDLSKITTPCECDCSSFVSICCICAGLPENLFFADGNMRTTYNLKEACEATGEFICLTSSNYTNSKDYLKRGDILLSSGHTVIVLSNGIKAGDISPTNVIATTYRVLITANSLNVRSGPSTDYAVITTVQKDDVYTIVEEKGGWGKLKSGLGWINLSYTQKM